MKVENDGNTRDTRAFREVRASMRIITLCHVFLCIMICWVENPPLPLLLYAKGSRVYMEDPSRL
jgi:hypothetical protein